MKIAMGITGMTLALVSGLALTPKPNASLASCYRLRLGLWSPATPGPESLPLVIRFDTVGASGSTAQGLLRPTINMDMNNVGTWETFAGDSIRFGWTPDRAGYSTVLIRAKIMGDSLIGVVSSGSFAPIDATAPASAYRTACPKHLR